MTKPADEISPSRRAFFLGSLGAAAALCAPRGVRAHEHEHDHAAVPKGIRRSEAFYRLPAVTLVRQDGARVAFPQELDDGHLVILDFIYTACTTVCPVTSMVFSQLQPMLGKDLASTKMVSISIDPEFDTPERLTEYAKKFEAKAQWQHYTGTREAILAVQKAFDAYRGEKMNHFPVTFLRGAPARPWVRLEGFATPETLAREYRELTRNA
jgi:protein SCO1